MIVRDKIWERPIQLVCPPEIRPTMTPEELNKRIIIANKAYPESEVTRPGRMTKADSCKNIARIAEDEEQKGFISKNSGTLEHTSVMGHIINKARTKQCSLIVTLLDLKNAFGEVHHNLISSALSYHQIPDGIQSLVTNLYTDFKTSIITNQFSTPAIPLHRGALQGDCLSPLLFDMCCNTFIQFIKAEKFKQLGFSDHDGTNHLFTLVSLIDGPPPSINFRIIFPPPPLLISTPPPFY